MRVVGAWNLQNGLMWKGRHEGSLDLGMNHAYTFQGHTSLMSEHINFHKPLILNFFILFRKCK